MKKGVPVGFKDSEMYRLPGKCRGPHKFREARIHVTFLKEDIDKPYFPDIFYHNLCRKCLQRE